MATYWTGKKGGKERLVKKTEDLMEWTGDAVFCIYLAIE
jgi:hypothetical protein